jgi:hypothetical protein
MLSGGVRVRPSPKRRRATFKFLRACLSRPRFAPAACIIRMSDRCRNARARGIADVEPRTWACRTSKSCNAPCKLPSRLRHKPLNSSAAGLVVSAWIPAAKSASMFSSTLVPSVSFLSASSALRAAPRKIRTCARISLRVASRFSVISMYSPTSLNASSRLRSLRGLNGLPSALRARLRGSFLKSGSCAARLHFDWQRRQPRPRFPCTPARADHS